MADPIPADIREAAVAAYLAKEDTLEALAKRYGISSGSISRFVRRHRYQRGLVPDGPHRGRPPTYDTDEMELLRQYTVEHPQATTTELRQFMKQRTGKSVGRNAMDNYLRTLGIRRTRQRKPTQTAPQPPPSTETRYTQRHRRHEPGTYPTDLTDHEWALLEEHFAPSGRGRPPEHSARTMLNAILYVLRTGCAWWMLPHDFPPYKSVYTTFRRWNRDGRLRRAHEELRREFRRRVGRNEDPSAIIVDSQTVKTTEKGGPRGYDAGKKTKGRKRHIAVDTEGILTGLVVHEAHIQDRDGAKPLLQQVAASIVTVLLVFFDSAYAGRLLDWLDEVLGWRGEVVRRPDDGNGSWSESDAPLGKANNADFPILPRRWVVERTFAWLGRYRRLSKDYEVLIEVSEAMIWLASLHLLTRRLAG